MFQKASLLRLSCFLLFVLSVYSEAINAGSRVGRIGVTIMIVCPESSSEYQKKLDFLNKLRKEFPGEKLGYGSVCWRWEGLGLSAYVQLVNPGYVDFHLVGRKRWLGCHKLIVRNLTEKKTVVVEKLSSYSELNRSKGKSEGSAATKEFKREHAIFTDPPMDLEKLVGRFKPGHLYKLELEAEPCFYNGIEPKPVRNSNAFRYLVVRRPKNAREEGMKLTHQAAKLVWDNPDDAEKLYKEALKKDPSLIGPRFGLGFIYERQGKLREALKVYESLLQDVEGRDRKDVEHFIINLRVKIGDNK